MSKHIWYKENERREREDDERGKRRGQRKQQQTRGLEKASIHKASCYKYMSTLLVESSLESVFGLETVL